MLILRNVTGVLQDVAGLQFDPNEERDIHADLQPTDIQDAWVNPLNKKLSDAMDDGDFIRVTPCLQLLYSGGPEGITCSQHNRFSFVLKAPR